MRPAMLSLIVLLSVACNQRRGTTEATFDIYSENIPARETVVSLNDDFSLETWEMIEKLGENLVFEPIAQKIAQPDSEDQNLLADQKCYSKRDTKRIANRSSLVRLDIEFTATEHGQCTGFFVKPEIIMTAAHCLVLNKDQETINAKAVLVRPNYRLQGEQVSSDGMAFASYFMTNQLYQPKQNNVSLEDTVIHDYAFLVVDSESQLFNPDNGQINEIVTLDLNNRFEVVGYGAASHQPRDLFRSIPFGSAYQHPKIPSLFHTDLAINPGVDGGPFRVAGTNQVAGINNASIGTDGCNGQLVTAMHSGVTTMFEKVTAHQICASSYDQRNSCILACCDLSLTGEQDLGCFDVCRKD